MAYYRHLTTVFFTRRCIKKLNESLDFNLSARDIKILYFLFCKGQRTIRNLQTLHSWKILNHYILPRLLQYDLIEVANKNVKITAIGHVILRQYNKILAGCRMDRINKWSETKRKQDKYW